jgi:predicted Rossmann fold flavoprotein
LVKATGHSIVPPVPSLFTFNLPGHAITQLMGVATPVRIRLAGTKWQAEGPCLITHWGLSGPAVLRLSAFGARHLADVGYRYSALINWLPNENETGLREQFLRHRQRKATQKIGNTDGIALPQRLWYFLLLAAGLQPDLRWADVPAVGQNKLAKCLCSYEVMAAGKTTFKDEFVTAGGVDTAEVDVAGMQSRLHPNLFFAGEILNVDGITGGFNFQHAWTSGFVAASAIANAGS